MKRRNKQIFNTKNNRNDFKSGRRVRLVQYCGKNSRKFLELNKIYFIREAIKKRSGNYSIYIKHCSKRFNSSIFELIYNKYDMIVES